MGSTDRLELPKEYNPWDRGCFGLMQKQSHFSVKFMAQGKLMTKTTSVQVIPFRIFGGNPRI